MAGTTRHGVARLNTDGTLDAAFVPPTTGAIGSGVAGDMMFYQMGPVSLEGGLYIFGEFQPANQPRATALRLRPDGSVDGSFRVATDFQINTGAVQPDGRLIIRGQFTTVNDVARGNRSRLNSDGSLDATWQSASTGGGVGVPLSLLPDGKLLRAAAATSRDRDPRRLPPNWSSR